MKKPLTVGKLKEILDQYDDNSLVKVYDSTFFDLVFVDKIFKKDDGGEFPDVIFQIKED